MTLAEYTRLTTLPTNELGAAVTGMLDLSNIHQVRAIDGNDVEFTVTTRKPIVG